jgi:hypothetical protein
MVLRNRYPSSGTLTIAGVNGTSVGQVGLGVQTLRISWPNDNPIAAQSMFWDTATPATGYIKYYNGSTWVNATMKYYNGSTWVTGAVRHWDGAQWVPSIVVPVYYGSAVVNGGASVSLPIPAFGAGHTIFGGWQKMPASMANVIFNTNNWEVYMGTDQVWGYDSVQYYTIMPNTQDGSSGPAMYSPQNSWVYTIIDRCSTSTVMWFLRDGDKAFLKMVFTATQPDTATSVLFGGGDGITSSIQNWWCIQGSTIPTMTQMLQMATTRGPVSGITYRSYWSLENGSGTDSVGSYAATTTATTSTYSAPTAITAPSTAYSTLFSKYNFRNTGNNLGDAYYPGSPLVSGSGYTVHSGWVNLPNATDCNAYVHMMNDLTTGKWINFVVQRSVANTFYQINIMTDANGDGNAYAPNAGTIAKANDWVFVAWVMNQSSGTNTSISTYFAFKGDSLALLGTETLPIAQVYGPSCYPYLAVGDINYSMCGFSIHSYTNAQGAPSLSTLQGFMSQAPSDVDSTAWAKWALADGSPLDNSGNSRDLILTAEVFRGDAIPA